MSNKGKIRSILFGDRQADRVVPPSGTAARLTLLASAAMAFLAVFALALALAAGRLASEWGDELSGTATLRVMAPVGEAVAQTEAALRVLETTAGVTAARALSDEEQHALLAPWFGAELSLDALPVPRLISVEFDPQVFEAAGLRLRLAAEVPAAVLDDHGRWRSPLARTANRLRLLAWGMGLMIAMAIAAIVTLAANAALAANAQIIAVLRLVGATDHYIASAFIRRFTLRAALGSVLGTVLGIAALALLPASSSAPGLLTGLGFQGAGWIVPVFLPLLSALVALAATAIAARKTLRGLA